MKPPRQFLALFRYSAFASPWLWIFPVTLGIQPCISLMLVSNRYSLEALLNPLVMFSFLPMIIAAFVFAGEKLFAGTPGMTPQTYQQIQTFAGDFLLTRAVDRPVVFQSRVALYGTLILLPLVVLIGLTTLRPEIVLEVPLKSPEKAAWYLSQLPGGVVTGTTGSAQVITFPHGRVALGGAIALLGVTSATLWPAFVYAILPLRFRKWIFWGGFIGIVFLPILFIGSSRGAVGGFERTVLWILNHGIFCAITVVVLGVASFFFCASRDREIEYP